jgi:hypothetical protein
VRVTGQVITFGGTPGFRIIRLDMRPRDYRLFGFLLDSIEGLATHTRLENPDVLEIQVSEGQMECFNSFLNYWRAFVS